MLARRSFFAIVIGFILMSGAAFAQQAPSASVQMNELGPENQAIAQQAGVWDVTETVWEAPGAVPTVTNGLVAERRMIGSALQEILRPASDVSGAGTKRIDYLSFNRVEGRWEYVSIDTRAPVGIMTASSFTRDDDGKVTLIFQPFAVAGPGPDVTGQMLRMDEIIVRQGPDRDVKEQHFIMADGTGRTWLAHRYAYVRRSS